MKIHGISRKWKHPIYVHLKKHYCPECHAQLGTEKVSRIVNSKSEEAKNFDFSLGDGYMTGNVKFVWTEFKCPGCGRQFKVDEMKKIEKRQKDGK